jgi:hypothetical protein
MKKTQKIGRNRGKARIWLEGASLKTMGWKAGDRFDCTFAPGSITYTRSPQGERAVAGDAKRPIIDTNTIRITESLPDATHADITVTPDRITITPGKAPAGIAATVAAAALFIGAIAFPYVTQFAPNAKRVLVACEESATVRDEFTRLGHDAVSCDIMPTRNPYGWHIHGDVRPHLDKEWDLVLGFPPCTYLTASAAWAFEEPDFVRYPGVGYHQRLKPGTLTGRARREAREEAIALVRALWDAAPQVAIENPSGFLSSMWRQPSQVIQPWHHGEPHSKTTCLWLKNLPLLQPTAVLDIKEHGYLAANGKWRWQNQTPGGQNKLPPSGDRAMIRSKTYAGIARAFAQQWGNA